MESEKKQRVREREQIGDKIEEELLPMEYTERRGNKTVTVIKETPCAYVSDLIDCKTVRIFAYSSTREQSNKMSGMRLKTESETGERRYSSHLTRPTGV